MSVAVHVSCVFVVLFFSSAMVYSMENVHYKHFPQGLSLMNPSKLASINDASPRSVARMKSKLESSYFKDGRAIQNLRRASLWAMCINNQCNRLIIPVCGFKTSATSTFLAHHKPGFKKEHQRKQNKMWSDISEQRKEDRQQQQYKNIRIVSRCALTIVVTAVIAQMIFES